MMKNSFIYFNNSKPIYKFFFATQIKMSINNIKVSAEGKTIDELIVAMDAGGGADGRAGEQKGTLPLVVRAIAVEPIREENQIALKVSELSTKHAPLSAERLRELGGARVREPTEQVHEVHKAQVMLQHAPPKANMRNEFKIVEPQTEQPIIEAVTSHDKTISIQSSFAEVEAPQNPKSKRIAPRGSTRRELQTQQQARTKKRPLQLTELLGEEVPPNNLSILSYGHYDLTGKGSNVNTQRVESQKMDPNLKQYKLFQHLNKNSLNLQNSIQSVIGSMAQDTSQVGTAASGSKEASLTQTGEDSVEYCKTARPGFRNPQLSKAVRSVHRRGMSDIQSSCKTSRNTRYNKPYPGFAFSFENVDEYTKLGKYSVFNQTSKNCETVSQKSSTGPVIRQSIQMFKDSKPFNLNLLQAAETLEAQASRKDDILTKEDLEISRNLRTASQSKRGLAALEVSDLDLLQQQQSSGGGDVSFFFRRNAPPGGTPDVPIEVSQGQFDPAYFCPSSHRPGYAHQGNFPALHAKPIAPGKILVNDVYYHGPATTRANRSQVGPQKGKESKTIVLRESARDQKINKVLQKVKEQTQRKQKHKKSGDSSHFEESQAAEDEAVIVKGFHRTYSPPRGRRFYSYEVKPEEFSEEMLTLSGGNRYHERTNPPLGKFINSIQGNLQISNDIKTRMKETSNKIFDQMKKTKHNFLKTLLNGESEGHCKGISKRIDPRIKDKQRQNHQRMKMLHEEQLEQVKKMKIQKDKERLEGQRKRIQQRLDQLGVAESAHMVKMQKGKAENLRRGSANGTGEEAQKMARKVSIVAKDEDKEENRQELELVVNEQGVAVISPPIISDEFGVATYGMESGSSSVTRTVSQKRKRQTARAETVADDRAARAKTQKADRAKALAQALNLKNLTADNILQVDALIRSEESVALCKLHKYFTSQHYQQAQLHLQRINDRVKVPKIFNNFKQLGLNDDPSFQEFFLNLCDEGKDDIKYAKMNRDYFKTFMQTKYSRQFSERMILFVENQFEHFSRISFNDYQDLITQLLNAGPECYRKLVFATMGAQNPGRICEHDIFTLMEQFKQKETFFFYKELMSRPDVPRDFQKMVDDSDKQFFKAFAKDTKVVAHVINLRKRLLGVIDMDTTAGLDQDFDQSKYADELQSKIDYEKDICNQIDYICQIINKRGGMAAQQEVLDILMKAKSLQEIRNSLCSAVAKHNLIGDRKNLNKKNSVGSYSDTTNQDGQKASTAEISPPINFHAPTNANPCLGKASNKRFTDCISVNYEDFMKLVDFRPPEQISSLAVDFIKTLTNGKIDLQKFEKEMAHYREKESSGFQGTIHYSKNNREPYNYTAKTASQVRQGSTNKRQSTMQSSTAQRQSTATENEMHEAFFERSTRGASTGAGGPIFQQEHVITRPFQIQDNYHGGEFIGKVLFKIKEAAVAKKSTRRQSAEASPENQGTQMSSAVSDAELAQEDSKKDQIELDEVKELYSYRIHFGLENFFNIFRCFYMLSNIPKTAQNNPFSLYMDENSAKTGFKAVFGIDIEEIAIRFFRLFTQPIHKTDKKDKIYILRFFYTVAQICCISHQERNYIRMGFDFYDYDSNGSIGSVDIINLYKYLSFEKMQKVTSKYKSIQSQREAYFLAKKTEKETGKKNKKLKQILEFDQQISVERLRNLEDEESESDQDDIIPQAQSQRKESLVAGSGETSKQASHLHSRAQATPAVQSGESSPAPIIKKSNIPVTLKYGILQEEEPELAKRINNTWNKFLFEVQMLRNYFVEEAVIPLSGAQSQRFLNLKTFELKLLQPMSEKYSNDELEQQFQTPAIIFFLRGRFITSEKWLNKKLVYGSKLSEADQASCSNVHVPPYKRSKGGPSPEDLMLNEYIKFVDRPHAPVSPEFATMVRALYHIIQVPGMIQPFDVIVREEQR